MNTNYKRRCLPNRSPAYDTHSNKNLYTNSGLNACGVTDRCLYPFPIGRASVAHSQNKPMTRSNDNKGGTYEYYAVNHRGL
jgi:hypothetical protein